MARVSLLGGAYKSASIIASAQRSVNLYPEAVPQTTKEGVQAVHLLRPGLRYLSSPPVQGRGRALYCATNGDLYALVDQNVYYINPDFAFQPTLGSVIAPAITPAYLADNGVDIVLVDGSPQGYDIKMATRVLSQIGDPNFTGADRVDYVDSFFVFNVPATQNWGSSLSNAVAFNALDFGSKTAWPDNIVSVITVEREVWLLGTKKGEIWYNAGLAGFPFAIIPGNIIEHGCAAKYSVAKQDVKVYWLSQSPEGNRMVMASDGHVAKRISNHAIEAEMKKYATVADAIGGCHQHEGHAWYKLHFPLADKSWVYDEATKEWHEQNWTDVNGVLHRTREAFYAFAYDTNVALDWATGTLYAVDPAVYLDQLTAPSALSPTGSPIVWVRSLPHMLDGNFQRITYNTLIADVEVGTGPNTQSTAFTVSPFSGGFSSGFGPRSLIEPPLISLRWSDDRGGSWGNKVMQSLGASGEYNTAPSWWNCGMARDKVFELSGSTPQQFSLNGVFAEYELHET